MRCDTTADPGAFWESAADHLNADPVHNSVIITNVLGRRDGRVTDPAPATYLTVRDDDGKVVGTAMRTPPFNLSLSPMPPDAVLAAVDALLASCPDAPGVAAVAPVAEAFASEWCRRTGRVATVGMRTRLHRLDVVRPPAAVPGTVRLATDADLDLLAAWERAFVVEIEGGTGEDEQSRARAALRLAEQRVWVWEDGEPVSYVGATLPAAGIVRVAPVYTPPAKRGRGYASALVAAVSQGLLDAGAEACVLFTDVANPTSNKIYAAVGYRPVSDVTVFRFGDPA